MWITQVAPGNGQIVIYLRTVDHLAPSLQLGEVVQDLHSTDPTHRRTWARLVSPARQHDELDHTRSGMDDLSASKDLDHQVGKSIICPSCESFVDWVGVGVGVAVGAKLGLDIFVACTSVCQTIHTSTDHLQIIDSQRQLMI